MHYLCLVYRPEPDGSDRDTQSETRALVEALVESGYDISIFPLAPDEEATSLRRTGDSLVLTDGPVTTGSARLQTVYLIGARDLNDVVRIAAWLPEARSAEFEIRPVLTFPQKAVEQPPSGAPAQEASKSSDQSVSVTG